MLSGITPYINLLKNPSPLGMGSVKRNPERNVTGFFGGTDFSFKATNYETFPVRSRLLAGEISSEQTKRPFSQRKAFWLIFAY